MDNNSTSLPRRQFLRHVTALGAGGLLAHLGGCSRRTATPRAPEILIRGGQVVNADRSFFADILIQGEKIVDIRMPGDGPSAKAVTESNGRDRRVVDAQGLLVLPGGIDPHVHLTDPWVDDFLSGSKAALAGGITTLGNMSFGGESESLQRMMVRHAEAAAAQTIADIMLPPGVQSADAKTLDELPELLQLGHSSLKVFMPNKNFLNEYDQFVELFRKAAELDQLVMVHCEDYEVIADAAQRLIADGKSGLRHFPESRPVAAEVIAVNRAIELCRETGAKTYVVHLSSGQALQACRAARSDGLPLYVETRPIYLHFTESRFQEADGPLFVGQPPLRQTADVDALWEGLASGSVHTLGSDHAPWTREQKMDPRLDISNLRPGINNLQVMLPILYSEGVRKNRITPEQFVALTSTNSAKLFGLYPKKGTISVGSDADLALWDPDERRTIDGANGFSRAGFSVYDGWEVTGWPKITVRRGEVAFEESGITAAGGSGRVLKRTSPIDL